MEVIEGRQDIVMKTRAGEVALIDFMAGVVLQSWQELCDELEFAPALASGKSRRALEHVVVSVYSYRYQPAPAAQSLPEPKWKDLIVGIDDDGPYPADEQLNGRKTGGIN